LVNDKQILERYLRMASEEAAVTFAGRLATYRYLDMDAAIEEALVAAGNFLVQDGLARRKAS
jgi:UDP-galactopyranose mutase